MEFLTGEQFHGYDAAGCTLVQLGLESGREVFLSFL